MGENEIKGLEEEIDSAVDRLFVERKGGSPEGQLRKPPTKDPTSYKMEKDLDLESSIQISPEAPPEIPLETPPVGPPFPKSIEKMESQLLSLEWEITKQNLGRTKEEIRSLQETLKDKPETISVLNLMEKVLDYMIKNEDKIRPPLVKFLLDSKETIKLLMRKETDSETNTYKQLAHVGIQARYSCLEEVRETKPERPNASLRNQVESGEIIDEKERQIDQILKKMNLFPEKVEELFRKMDQHLLRLEQSPREPPKPMMEAKPLWINVTVLKVGEKLFGVESDRILKLFRVPSGFQEKYTNQQKIRLKDFEVRLIDLRQIFSIRKGGPKEETKILAVKGDEEYKGLMIDQVLERLSTPSDVGGTPDIYFMGTFHWTYQERVTEIPILDLNKF